MIEDAKRSNPDAPEDAQSLAAGDFLAWFDELRDALVNGSGVDVPCGECNACCRSSMFIHIRPDEAKTLARIPKALLFPAPLQPKGNMLLGYDEHGRCPMLKDDRCVIYADRSLTCRQFDCRIFAAAGIAPDEDGEAPIPRQVRRWEFSYPTPRDRDRHAAVQAAAEFLSGHSVGFPDVPRVPIQLALLAIKASDAFLGNDEASGRTGRPTSDLDMAEKVMEAIERFEGQKAERP